MNEMTSMTIRLEMNDCEKFKKISRDENISQGELLKKMMTQYKGVHSEGIEAPIVAQEDNKIRLLLKELNGITSINKEAKIYSFTGRLIYSLPGVRTIFNFSYERLKEEIGFDATTDNYSLGYQFFLYEQLNSEKKYIIYEYINVTDTIKNIAVVNIKRAKFAENLVEINNKLCPYITMQEADNIEYLLAEDISNNKELLNDYIK